MVNVKVTKNELSIDFVMPQDATIFEVKQMVESLMNFEVHSQALFCNGQMLEENRSLESYNFREIVCFELDTVPPQLKFYILAKSPVKETRMKVKSTTTVLELREKVERKWAIFSHILSLKYNGEMMSDDLPLSHYEVRSNSVIEVVVGLEPR
ncbi:hypothetical protein MANES_09G067397v8 [Manihot esculenta]|uniref:Uncharacterized protein n=1 Tax=Manihot esculenta TaxID=3983 RepID=A0ACB7H4S7_MANES|nr:hypothetical protein MANES_09G067397v8 [Manihot esculenta]